MANNIDDILTRLDEIKKLQTELRNLVPRVASNSPRAGAKDSTSDKSALIRFPSLFTFPGVPSFTSPSARNERVQKSTARLNLSSKLSLSDNQPTTSAAWRPTKAKSSVKEMNVFRDSPKNANGIVPKSYAKNSVVSNASTSATNSARTTQSLMKNNTANRNPKHLQGAIKKGLNNEIASADKKSHTTLDKSNPGSNNENNPKASEWFIVKIIKSV